MFAEILNKIRANPGFYLMILVTIIILCVAAYMVFQKSKPNLKTSIEPGASKPVSSQEAEVLFFYANWCPHCKAAKPHWNEVKNEYDGKTINGYTLKFTDIDCTEETPDVKQATDEYEIEGYPTIKLIKDGQVIDYDAKPTKDTLEKFITTVL